MLATICCLVALSLNPVDNPSPTDPIFQVVGLDGKTVRGRIRGFGPQGDLRMVTADDIDFTRQVESVYKLTRTDPVISSARPEGGIVVLPDGDILLRSSLGSSNDNGLVVNSLSLGQLTLPLDTALGYILNPPSDPDNWDALVTRVRSETRNAEVIWLSNGDRASGGLLSVDENTVLMQVNGKKVSLDRPGVVALGFDPTQLNYAKPKGPYWELTLIDGSRIGITQPKIEQGLLVATTRFGAVIRVAQSEIQKLTGAHARIVWLGDRAADLAQYTPYLGPVIPYHRNQTATGGSMRLTGEVFDRGLGTQSRTRLAYKLTPGDQRFQATVGVDDRAGGAASVKFRVWLDRTAVVTSELMGAGDAPLAIDIALGDAKVLILETDFGARGNVRDYADWADARLIRDSEPEAGLRR